VSRKKGRKLQVWVSDEMYEALKEYAEKKGVSISDVVRQLITDLMHRKDYKPDVAIQIGDKTFYSEIKHAMKEALRETILENLGVKSTHRETNG